MMSKGAISELSAPERASQEGFYSNIFLVPKKDGKVRPVINLKKLNQFVQTYHFKMEGIQTARELVRPNNWLTKIDLKDAYFTIPICKSHQKYLRFMVEHRAYQFNCLPFGLSSAPWIFTKTLRPVAAKLRELGIRLVVYLDDILVIANSLEQATDHTSTLIYTLEYLGFIVHPEKSMTQPTQRVEFLGMIIDTVSMELQVPGPKNEKNQSRSEKYFEIRASIGKRSYSPDWENDCNRSSDPTSPAVLSDSPERCVLGIGNERSELRCSLSNITEEHRGATLVDRSFDRMEWEESHKVAEPRHSDRIRCLPHRVGSNVQWSEHGRPVERSGESLAYQLLGDSSSHSGGSDLREKAVQSVCTTTVGQYDCSLLHQSLRGYSFPTSNTTSENLVAMVPEAEHLIESTTSSRQGECNSRSGIPCDEGQVRLETEPNSIQPIKTVTSDDNRSVCITPHSPTASVFQLETRPPSSGNRCLPTGLVRYEGICQPALESDRQSPRKDPRAPGHSDGADNSTLAIPSVVSSGDGSVGRGTTPPSRGRKLDDTNGGENATRGSSQTSRVAYLKQSYSTQRISESASQLLLASWREKSTKSYDSLFRKWGNWCEERNTDPISSPVSEVVNFLAELHDKGYSYRSLNAYRSAISSIHDRVDGAPVGQHPLVCRLLAGVFNSNPPQPRYTSTWDVNVVVNYLKTLQPNLTLSLKFFTLKTVMLMALSRPSRSADLSLLSMKHYRVNPEGLHFTPTGLTKQSRAGKVTSEMRFNRFTEDESICPVVTGLHYIHRTESLRSSQKGDKLFISWIKPHNSVTSCSIARWLKTVLTLSGIDTSIFKAHSVRGASVSAARNLGVTTKEILDTADWSTESVFQKYYYKPVHSTAFSKAVLGSQAQK